MTPAAPSSPTIELLRAATYGEPLDPPATEALLAGLAEAAASVTAGR